MFLLFLKALDYSDDEKEKEAKRKFKNLKKIDNNNQGKYRIYISFALMTIVGMFWYHLSNFSRFLV